MEIFLSAFILDMASKYPVILTIVAFMGMARAFLKPTMTFLHEVVIITKTTKDNDLLDKVEDSKVYKSILFVLDYVLSLKIKK